MFKVVKGRFLVLFVLVSVMVAALAPATAHGWILWSGIDPALAVNGHQYNVSIEWPSQYGCTIHDPIQVSVAVPKDASVQFQSESSGDPDNCGYDIVTNTVVRKVGAGTLGVAAKLSSADSFTVRVKVYQDGSLVRTYMGRSNGMVTGMPLLFP